MAWLTPAVVATLSGSLVLVFVYAFLYTQDRERYIGIWAWAWAAYVIRYALLLWMLLDRETTILLIGNQLAPLVNGLLLLWGIYVLLGKEMPKWWILGATLDAGWVVAAILLRLPFLALSIPTFTFLAVVNIWAGVIFLRAQGLPKAGRQTTGWAFVVWGAHKADYPFLRPVVWFAPWGYLISAVLELLVAIGILLVYLQQARQQLGVSEARVGQLAETARDVVYRYRLKPTPCFEYISPSITAISGYTPEEFYADPLIVMRLIHPEDRPLVKAYMRSPKSHPNPFNLRWRIKSGRTIWTEQRNVPILDPAGNMLALEGIVHDITERRQAKEEIERRNRALSLLNRVVAAASSSLDAREILEIVCHELVEAFGADGASAALFDNGCSTATIVAEDLSEGTPSAVGFTYPIARNPAAQYVIDSKKPMEAVDAQNDPRLTLIHAVLSERAIVSLLVTPLIVRGEVVGTIGLTHSEPRVYSHRELVLAANVATAASQALHNAQLFEAEREQHMLSDALRGIATTITSTLDIEDVLNRILADVGKVVAHDAANIMLLSTPEDSVRIAGRRGYEPRGVESEMAAMHYRIADVPNLRQMAASAQPLAIPDTHSDSLWKRQEHTQWIRSYAGAPICLEGKVIGFLNLDSATPNFFNSAHAERLQAFAEQAAVAIHNARLFNEAQQRTAELEALRHVMLDITAELDLSSLLTALVENAIQLMGAESGGLYLYRRELDLIEGVVGVGKNPMKPYRTLKRGEGVSGRVWASGEPLIVDDYPQWDGRATIYEDNYIQAVIGVPIRWGDDFLGVLVAGTDAQGEHFSQEDAHLLAQFADQAAIAIHNAQLYETIHERVTRLELVSQIAQQTTAILKTRELLQRTVELVGSTFDYYATEIWLAEGAILTLKASYPPAPVEISNFKIHLGSEGIINRVAQKGEPLLAPDVSQASDYLSITGKRQTQSELAVPIKLQDDVVGVLNVESIERSAFSEVDRFTLQAVAGQLAVGLQNSQLYQALEDYSDILEQGIARRTAELRQEKEQAEVILHGAADAVMLADAKGTIISVNPAFEEQTGYRMGEIVGQHGRILHHPDSNPTTLKAMLKAVASSEPWRGEIALRRKDGSPHEAEFNTAPLGEAGSGVRGYVTVIRDISVQKEVARMKDAFISNVSHELRTPITDLKLYHALLRSGKPDSRQKYLAVVERETLRLELIVEDLLRLSRLDQAHAELDLKPVDLNELVSQYVIDRAPVAREQGLALEMQQEVDLPPVQADEGLIGQTLSIFLTNALNYTPNGGRVRVETMVDSSPSHAGAEPWIGFSISDDGPGIPPDEQEEIFQRFYRGRVGRDSGAPGTGLGLAIAKEIVDRHGGLIEVKSDGEAGKGVTFVVWLPAALEQESGGRE
jgi:PAS domain S-box-containing protein